MYLFFLLLISGILLLGAEIFLPGGVLGLLGGMALLAAVVLGFFTFGAATGIYLAFGIIILTGLGVWVWIKLFPRTNVGKTLTLDQTAGDYKASDKALQNLTDQIGKALTDLRPSGVVRIDGKNYSVVSDGPLIERGTEVKVVKVGGNRIVVQKPAQPA